MSANLQPRRLRALNGAKRWLLILICLSILVVIALLIAACATRTTANWAANKIFANVDLQDDREVPPTAQSIAFSGDQQWLIGGRGMGLSCSLPWWAPPFTFTRGKDEAPVSLQFRQACAYHDYCYRHGAATYGYTQARCDYLLQEHSYRLCKQIYGATNWQKCITNARKVLLGVRVCGSKAFKQKYHPDGAQTSTYFEFDQQPTTFESYKVIRVADARRADGQAARKAIYQFNMRPSGMRVSVMGLDKNGRFEAIESSTFKLHGAYHHLMSPPIVVRDARDAEDWFVWWQRESPVTTGGRFVFLRPATATAKDWRSVFTKEKSDPECTGEIDLKNADGAPALNLSVIHCKVKTDLEILQFQAREGPPDGILQLTAQTTGSCGDDGAFNRSLCYVDIGFRPGTSELSHSKRRMNQDECVVSGKSCDRYRGLVSAPALYQDGNQAGVISFRRGLDSAGKGYETNVVLNVYSNLCQPSAAGPCASKLATLKASEFDEPLQPLMPDKPLERLLSFRLNDPENDRGAFEIFDFDLRQVAYKAKEVIDPQRCQMPDGMKGDWLAIPPNIVRLDGNRHLILLAKRQTLLTIPLGKDVNVAELQFKHSMLPEVGCPGTWTEVETQTLTFGHIFGGKDFNELNLQKELRLLYSDPIIVVKGLDSAAPNQLHVVWVALDFATQSRAWKLPDYDVVEDK